MSDPLERMARALRQCHQNSVDAKGGAATVEEIAASALACAREMVMGTLPNMRGKEDMDGWELGHQDARAAMLAALTPEQKP